MIEEGQEIKVVWNDSANKPLECSLDKITAHGIEVSTERFDITIPYTSMRYYMKEKGATNAEQ